MHAFNQAKLSEWKGMKIGIQSREHFLGENEAHALSPFPYKTTDVKLHICSFANWLRNLFMFYLCAVDARVSKSICRQVRYL